MVAACRPPIPPLGTFFSLLEEKRQEGERREWDDASRLQRVTIPLISKRRGFSRRCRTREELAQFEVLHRRWAKPIFDKCMKLGGFY